MSSTIPHADTWITIARARVIDLAGRIVRAETAGLSDLSTCWLASYREALDAVESMFGVEEKERLIELFDGSLAEARKDVTA